jgi:hypothetical protein
VRVDRRESEVPRESSTNWTIWSSDASCRLDIVSWRAHSVSMDSHEGPERGQTSIRALHLPHASS